MAFAHMEHACSGCTSGLLEGQKERTLYTLDNLITTVVVRLNVAVINESGNVVREESVHLTFQKCQTWFHSCVSIVLQRDITVLQK